MLIDIHAHLDRYEGEIESALAQIRQNDIFTVSNSMDVPSYERNIEIASKCGLVFPTFGIHPWNASDYADHLENLEDAIEGSSMIGEIGLDYFFIKDSSLYPDQRKVFKFFLDAARGQNKVVILHTKGAEQDVFELLTRYHINKAIIHWYSGPHEILRRFVDLGVYITVGPEVLHSEHICEVATLIPLDQLLTETDNPGGPKSFLGKMGMPLLIRDVVCKLAELRECSYDDIVQSVHRNLLGLAEDNQWLEQMYERLVERESEDTQQTAAADADKPYSWA